MKKIILHIPHSSTGIPFTKGYVVEQEVLDSEILKLTDWYTDDLFSCENSIPIRADFSRIFCDTERFADDSQEIMAKYGMGVLYEKTDDGRPLRKVTEELRNEILSNFYEPHHHKLTKTVDDELNKNGKTLIVDCHSFPDIPIVRDLDQRANRPDFNIGTDSFHTPQKLVKVAEEFFKSKGCSLGVDEPYKGALVPLKHYRKTKNVYSIMLEINRKLYLNEPTNKKSENYLQTKKVVGEFLEVMRNGIF